MTISNLNYYITYQGNGSAVTYPIPFMFFTISDLQVTIHDNYGNSKILNLSSYNISGSGQDLTANLHLVTPVLNGQVIEIKRKTSLIQATKLNNYDRIDGQILENALDRNVMMIQEAAFMADRALKVANNITPPQLSDPKNHAGQVLVVSQDENHINYYDASAVKTVGLYNKNSFSGDGVIRNFTLSFIAASSNSVLVVVNKQLCEPGIDYSINSNNLIFSVAPPIGNHNIYIVNLAETQAVTLVSDASITANKIMPTIVLPNPELKQFSQTVQIVSSINGQLNLDLTKASCFNCTLTENTIFNFLNPPVVGKNIGFKLFLNTGNNSYKITWPVNIRFPYGFVPDLSSPRETHILIFETIDSGANWYGALVMESLL